MVTIHLVLNAHLDPVWLWPWQAGLDAALATCRSACDRLDAHPDVIFTRGEAWVYHQIEQVDPALFERIRRHVKSGQWEIVGGWWIQPDCNLPSDFALRRQIELGKAYFLDRFGFFPRIGYNVDSFGHSAGLPALLREAGQDCYVMMRPQEHEMALPARLFRWRGAAGGPQVKVFRIARAYCTPSLPTIEHVKRSLSELPPGIEHTMCFLGVGDHGGGATEEMIAWCRAHRRAIDGAVLEFSSPGRFFAAIARQSRRLPLVSGELQYHAIGRYSVYRPIKLALRQAEHLLEQAEIAHRDDPRPDPAAPQRLQEAWRQVCLHQFHDTLGGTCIPSAYPQVEAQLGAARAMADELIHLSLRRRLAGAEGAAGVADDPMQRLVLFNPSDMPFDGYVEVEPWLGWQAWQEQWRLLDECGRPIAPQRIAAEAVTGGQTRLLFPLKVATGRWRILRIDRIGPTPAVSERAHDKKRKDAAAGARARAGGAHIAWGDKVAVDWDGQGEMRFGRQPWALPRLDLIDDSTDTWSHGTDRYPDGPAQAAQWQTPLLMDYGPLMASLICQGHIGQSPLRAEYRVYRERRMVDLRLRVHWSEMRKVLKLTLALPALAARRIDGILGGELERPLSGRECPLRDRVLVELADGQRLGIVCPEVFAIDGTAQRLRLTLLRSPLMAHHDPHPPVAARGQASDQGVHEFRIRFFHGASLSGADLDQEAIMQQRPLILAELTAGMLAT